MVLKCFVEKRILKKKIHMVSFHIHEIWSIYRYWALSNLLFSFVLYSLSLMRWWSLMSRFLFSSLLSFHHAFYCIRLYYHDYFCSSDLNIVNWYNEKVMRLLERTRREMQIKWQNPISSRRQKRNNNCTKRMFGQQYQQHISFCSPFSHSILHIPLIEFSSPWLLFIYMIAIITVAFVSLLPLLLLLLLCVLFILIIIIIMSRITTVIRIIIVWLYLMCGQSINTQFPKQSMHIAFQLLLLLLYFG